VRDVEVEIVRVPFFCGGDPNVVTR
jgi:hypothetical protein